MPFCVHVEVTLYLRRVTGKGFQSDPLLQKSERGVGVGKASSLRRKKTAIGWIIKNLLSLTTLGLLESKM